MSYNQKDFNYYDAENPEVWELFERFALEAAQYRGNYSANAIFQRIRWETMIQKKGSFKVNNNWSKHYAHKFMVKYPQYVGFFRTRQSS